MTRKGQQAATAARTRIADRVRDLQARVKATEDQIAVILLYFQKNPRQ